MIRYPSFAKGSLAANIVDIEGVSYLKAGGNQFESLWTRDFCFSVPGLFCAGKSEVARAHLETLIESARESDGLVPRTLDTVKPMWRVLRVCLGLGRFGFNGPLKPEYVDEHGSIAIDSNALLVIAAVTFAQLTNDKKWLDSKSKALRRIIDFYDAHLGDEGLVKQAPFSDWQDSQKREGVNLYVNVLYAKALSLLNMGKADEIKKKIHSNFYDKEIGLYVSSKANQNIELDSNLLGLIYDVFPVDKKAMYEKLKASDLWLGSKSTLPGFISSARKPRRQKSLTVLFAGLSNYHEDLYWSWLIAYSLKLSKMMGDLEEARRLEHFLGGLFTREGTVYEIYRPESFLPVETRFYYSERPFSWGAATALEAFEYRLKPN